MYQEQLPLLSMQIGGFIRPDSGGWAWGAWHCEQHHVGWCETREQAEREQSAAVKAHAVQRGVQREHFTDGEWAQIEAMLSC